MVHAENSSRFLEDLLSSALIEEEASEWILKHVAAISPRWLRFLASYYPDARVRRVCLIQSGVQLGPETYPNYGIYVVDRYNQQPREDLLHIGARVAMGPRVTFVCDSAPNASRLARLPEVQQRMIRKGPIVVGDDAWIGTGATILPGIRIGEMSVIGAHSLVREDVEAYAVVAGSPARVVGSLTAPSNRSREGDAG